MRGPTRPSHCSRSTASRLRVASMAATLGFGGVIISESALSFLGFGVMPPTPTWGNMLNDARGAPLEHLFTQTLSPGLFIFLTVLAVNFLGDGLRDALDPRLKL